MFSVLVGLSVIWPGNVFSYLLNPNKNRAILNRTSNEGELYIKKTLVAYVMVPVCLSFFTFI